MVWAGRGSAQGVPHAGSAPPRYTGRVAVLLVSTYDLGRQPFGLASPAAWLRSAGFEVATCDLSRERLDESAVRAASLVGFYLPMHTATRLALPVIDRVRRQNPAAALAAFGLYAPLGRDLLRLHGVAHILGPEYEPDLLALARSCEPIAATDTSGARSILERQDARRERGEVGSLPRVSFRVPDRSSLPPLSRYAGLRMPDGTVRLAGATDATRGCKHRCRHCPIVPIYDGRFRAVPVDIVLADIDQQVSAGAQHITFGDPDFFNGPAHARRIVEALHARHPDVTYDVTIKIEHLLAHRDLLPLLTRTGCLFVTSAVESLDDRVLALLEKGHTRADFLEAAALCRRAGVALAPTFVAFTPWTTLETYADLLETIERLDLVENVAPVQWTLRLLVTPGSRLLELDEIRTKIGAFDSRTLTYPWAHDDPRVDALQRDVMRLVARSAGASRRELFEKICERAGLARARRPVLPSRATVPYLDEPWYC